MKNLVIINGTMGIGKTATSKDLQKLLPNCVFLDGDWCWDMNPFIVNIETKNMVEDNISYILNNFLKCSKFENIIFCWVMHEENILKSILSKLNLNNINIYKISLICTEKSLEERLAIDIKRGIRTKDIISRSISKLSNYGKMDSIKIDVSNIDSKQAAEQIIKHIGE